MATIAHVTAEPEPVRTEADTCFVISPLGSERAELVLRLIIGPACARAGYDALRGDDSRLGTAERITESIFRRLDASPMAIAYLGAPARSEGRRHWNSNVMFEVGYRLAKGMPVVLLCEAREGPTDPLLPFDLYDVRALELPRELSGDGIDQTIVKLGQRLQQAGVASSADTDAGAELPQIAVRFTARGGIVTRASSEAERLFRPPAGLVGMDVAAVVDALRERMTPPQSRRSPRSRAG